MKRKILLIVIFLLLCLKPSKAAFNYDPNQAMYKVQGTIETFPGESWYCPFNWSGGEGMEIAIQGINMPRGMYIDPNDWTFGWVAGADQTGIFFVDFSIGKRIDPNQVIISDRCTIVIQVEELPKFEPMCGG